MFETDFNLWLQAFASPWLTALMETVSFLGYEWFYIAATIFAAFALRLRPMLGVMLALLLAGVGTYAAKDGLQLPRSTSHCVLAWPLSSTRASTCTGRGSCRPSFAA